MKQDTNVSNIKTCDSCGFIHEIDTRFRDKKSSCYRCRKTRFHDSTEEEVKQLKTQHIPPFCDWQMQDVIEHNAKRIVIAMFDRYNQKVPENAQLVYDITTWLIVAANSSRKTFAEEGKDAFISHTNLASEFFKPGDRNRKKTRKDTKRGKGNRPTEARAG